MLTEVTLCKVPMIYANVFLDDTVIDSTVITKSLTTSLYIYGTQIIGEPKDRNLPDFQISVTMEWLLGLVAMNISISFYQPKFHQSGQQICKQLLRYNPQQRGSMAEVEICVNLNHKWASNSSSFITLVFFVLQTELTQQSMAHP